MNGVDVMGGREGSKERMNGWRIEGERFNSSFRHLVARLRETSSRGSPNKPCRTGWSWPLPNAKRARAVQRREREDSFPLITGTESAGRASAAELRAPPSLTPYQQAFPLPPSRSSSSVASSWFPGAVTVVNEHNRAITPHSTQE